MQSLANLDLPELPLEQPFVAEDPGPHFAAARRRHPWLAKWNLGIIITDYHAVRELMRMEDKMRLPFDELVEFMGARGTPWGRFQENHILAKTGAAHKRMREILAPAFTPQMANIHRPLMRAVIAELLDEWAPKGAFDFEEFASYFPITVMCTLIGAPPAAIPELRWAMETLGLSVSMDRSYVDDFQKATLQLEAFIEKLVGDREQDKHPPRKIPDLLDIMLKAKKGGTLSQDDLVNILIFLFVAGYDTSKNVLTLTMHQLIKHPEIYKKCAEDVTYARKVIEESMRYNSPSSTSRRLTDDLAYRDVLLPKGTTLWMPWAIAGRDEGAIEDADAFKPERPVKNPHIGFALGAHICLGQHIARAQLEEGLHQMAQRITNPKSPGPQAWRPFPGVWGIKGLPITFDPAPARVKVPA